jgi:hypothetical protein
MSTRCHIRIKEDEEQYLLYHHHDGYPGGVGVELKKFLAEIEGDWFANEIANELVKGGIKQKMCPDMGYEITSCVHGDEQYVYVIDCVAQTLKCYVHKWDETFEQCCIASREVEIP